MLTPTTSVTTLVVAVALLSGCHNGPGPGAAPQARVGGQVAVSPLLDTLAARLATLELERAMLLASHTPEAPARARADRNVEALRRQLAELPNPRVAEAYAADRTLQAFEERLAGLLVDRKLLMTTHTAESPQMREINSVVTALERRQAELRQTRL